MCLEDHFSMKHLKIDGGVTNSEFLIQFQADVLGISIIKPKNVEVTALGVAFLAGLAVGFWSDLEEIKQLQSDSMKYHPKIAQEFMEPLRKRWKYAVEITRKYAVE